MVTSATPTTSRRPGKESAPRRVRNTGHAPGEDGFVAKYDADGTFLWGASVESPSDERAQAVVVLADGTYAVAGEVGDGAAVISESLPTWIDTEGGLDTLLARLTDVGALVGVRWIGGTADDRCSAAATDGASIWLGLGFNGFVQTGDVLQSAGGTDTAILRVAAPSSVP